MDTPDGEDRPDHPTPKPLDCFAIPMKQHVARGGLCYEPFSGSGSQIMAGEQTGRRVYAMEISPPYCDVAVKRWQQATGDHAVLEGDGRKFEDVRGGADRVGSATAATARPGRPSCSRAARGARVGLGVQQSGPRLSARAMWLKAACHSAIRQIMYRGPAVEVTRSLVTVWPRFRPWSRRSSPSWCVAASRSRRWRE